MFYKPPPNYSESITELRFLTRHALFGDLPVIDLLLQCKITDKAVNVAVLPLTVTIHATHRLGIVTGVPRCVEHNNPTGPDQIDPQTARSERANK